ncbi:MAG: YeeE/YedE family protein [Acidobacteria bacterium]|nr:YeeE/YedE family protein [Candidatus Sulfomarinibacter sp. MAG AM2]
MASTSFWSSLKEEARRNYIAIFEQEWPTWLAGIFLALVALLIFLWKGPWGVAAGYRNLGDWIFYAAGVGGERPPSMWLHPITLTSFGLIIGALVSALMSRQFKVHRAPPLEYVKSLIGGIFMGAGAVLAAGCNVGGFYTASAMLDMGGLAMMAGLIAGAWIGLRYLLWEMEHVPQKGVEQHPPGDRWLGAQPYLGGIFLILVIAAFYAYSVVDQTELGGLLFFGSLIGLIMHRSRFCFVRAFRCPFMTGDAEMVKIVAMSLMIYGMGTAVIKWAWIQEPSMGVNHNFWIGSLLGGVIFGIGMLLAGGCASSTLWRIGEGQTKMVVTLIAFAVTNSLLATTLKHLDLYDKMGQGLFIPDTLSWYVTVPSFLVFFVFWAFVAIWNEKSEKFVIF